MIIDLNEEPIDSDEEEEPIAIVQPLVAEEKTIVDSVPVVGQKRKRGDVEPTTTSIIKRSRISREPRKKVSWSSRLENVIEIEAREITTDNNNGGLLLKSNHQTSSTGGPKIFVDATAISNLRAQIASLENQVQSLSMIQKEKDYIIMYQQYRMRNRSQNRRMMAIHPSSSSSQSSSSSSSTTTTTTNKDYLIYSGRTGQLYDYSLSSSSSDVTCHYKEYNRYDSHKRQYMDSTILGVCCIENNTSAAMIASSTDRELIVWDMTQRDRYHVLQDSKINFFPGKIIPFKEHLINVSNIDMNCELHLWNVRQSRIISRMSGFNDMINDVCSAGSAQFTTNHQLEYKYLFSACKDKRLRRHCPETESLTWNATVPDNPVSICWSHLDQLVFCGTFKGDIIAHDIRQNGMSAIRISNAHHQHSVNSLIEHKGFILSASSTDKQCHVWDIRKFTGTSNHRQTAAIPVCTISHSHAIYSLANIQSRREFVLGCEDDKALLYEFNTQHTNDDGSSTTLKRTIVTRDAVMNMTIVESL